MICLDDSTSISLERAQEAQSALVLRQERSTRHCAATFDPDWRWRQFLENLPQNDTSVSKESVDAVFDFIESASSAGKRLPATATFATDDGIKLIWTTEPHYLELDVFPNKRFEWFYKNRETGVFEGTAEDPEQSISAGLQARLNLFRR